MTSEPRPPTRKLPNPWVAIPVAAATVVGWFVGSSVARVSCRPDTCTGDEILWGVAGALIGFVGVLVVAVLAVRSLSEWASLSEADKQRRRDDGEPPVC